MGEKPLDLADGFDGLDAVPSGFLLSGGDREGEAVDDDVALAQSPLRSNVGDRTPGDAYLPLRGTRLAFLIDGQHDHRRTMLGAQLHDPVESRVWPVAILVVGGVDHR